MGGIKRALISVSEKSGLEELARSLHEEFGVEILSTGGTCRFLQEKGIPVTEVSEYTGFPELFGGRVKTLHPRIHGGLLAPRSEESQRQEMAANDVPPIDLVAVNLYPFESVVAREDTDLAEAVENVDIGGPTMLRAAAKMSTEAAEVLDPYIKAEDWPAHEVDEEELEREVGDVFVTLVGVCQEADLDLGDCVEAAMQKNASDTWREDRGL